ncbi:MAG: T9SS type A sorting domain-containing protein [Bacteroidetes bacterium]|nr:T9SS type A sorting domain-containing protein [Bacteroidota bacterium]
MHLLIGMGEVVYQCTKCKGEKCNGADIRWAREFEVKSLKSNAGYFTLDVDCAGWASGVYLVYLETEAERLSKKFVKS